MFALRATRIGLACGVEVRPTKGALVSESTLEALGGGVAAPAQFGHDALVVCDNLVRIFQSGSVEVQALQGLDLLVDEGEMVAIVGAPGRASPPCSRSCPASTHRPRAACGWVAGT